MTKQRASYIRGDVHGFRYKKILYWNVLSVNIIKIIQKYI